MGNTIFLKNSLFIYFSKVALRIIGIIPSHFKNRIVSRFWLDVGVIMSKDKYYEFIVSINEDVTDASLRFFAWQ